MMAGSLFTGIGGLDLGFARAGISTRWQVEKEPFCQAVLKTRFPGAELFDDVTQCGKRNLGAVDVITGGFPCQGLSVAGKRRGLADDRSGLFWEAHRIIGELRPAWFVIENVPGFFSSWTDAETDRLGTWESNDFDTAICALHELGYGLAWRVFDSRYFNVAQRRDRVFIVGCLGKPCPREVLFESSGGKGDFAPGREKRQDIAGTLAAGAHASGFNRQDATRGNIVNSFGWNKSASQTMRVDSETCGPLQASECSNPAVMIGSSGERERALTSSMGKRHDNDTDTLIIASPLTASAGHHGHSSPRGDGQDNLVVAATLNSGGNEGGFRTEPGEHIVIQDVRGGTRDKTDSGQGIGIREGGPCYTLSATERHGISANHSVRRLTPVECERLQGFPDGWTIPAHEFWKYKDDPEWPLLPKGLDSARYRALGNAVTVNVAEWIARRIVALSVRQEVEHG